MPNPARRLGLAAVLVALAATLQVVVPTSATALPPICDIDCGDGGGGGGGVPVPPFNPPARPYPFQAPNLPLYDPGPPDLVGCQQIPHVWVGDGWDVTQGTVLYGTGVVVPGTRINFGFYTPGGLLVKTKLTAPAGSNCVVAHEPETVTTSDLAPGYYFVYASYHTISTNGVAPPDAYSGYKTPSSGRYVSVLRVR